LTRSPAFNWWKIRMLVGMEWSLNRKSNAGPELKTSQTGSIDVNGSFSPSTVTFPYWLSNSKSKSQDRTWSVQLPLQYAVWSTWPCTICRIKSSICSMQRSMINWFPYFHSDQISFGDGFSWMRSDAIWISGPSLNHSQATPVMSKLIGSNLQTRLAKGWIWDAKCTFRSFRYEMAEMIRMLAIIPVNMLIF